MTTRPLTKAILADLWPWTDGRFSPTWYGSITMAGIDEFAWSWNAEAYETLGLSA